MIRILVILAIIGAGLFYAYSRLADSLAVRSAVPSEAEQAGSGGLSGVDLSISGKESSGSSASPVTASRSNVSESSTFFVHQFKNRLAPRVPEFLRDKDGVGIFQDEETNSWIVESPSSTAPHLLNVVKLLDVAPEELDLDFVLLSVSERWLRSVGVNLAFDEGASFMSTLGIFDTTGGLRFASGAVSIDIDYTNSNEYVSVYRSPVVRVLEGDSWSISEAIESPVPVTQTVDGVSTSSVEYVSVGLSLQGRVSKGSKGYRLDIDQRNGTQGAQVQIGDLTLPERRVQSLSTAVYLEKDMWTICGGVRNVEATTSKGIFKKEKGHSKDLLLIFCRPRSTLRKIYKAIPVDEYSDVDRIDSLLPAKP